jgi:hypothetical protein
MGRPLNKKYFGNRNVGSTSTTADNGIGGEGIAGIIFSSLGSFAGNNTVAPITIPAFPAPTLPGGIQATYTLTFEVDSVVTGAGKTNLAVGDTFGVTSIPGMIAQVINIAGANAVFSVTTAGASRGNALALAAIPTDTVGITLTKIAGTGTAGTFVTDITFRAKEVTITEKGSGYTGAETFSAFTKPGTTNGTVPAGTFALTVDTGAVGSATNQENAIIIRANTSNGGTTAKVGDIIRQVSTRRYKVKTADGIKICALGTTTTPAPLGAYIVATATGGTYYVTKLTAHKATLATKTGDGVLNGQAVQWTFGAPSATIVQIENA